LGSAAGEYRTAKVADNELLIRVKSHVDLTPGKPGPIYCSVVLSPRCSYSVGALHSNGWVSVRHGKSLICCTTVVGWTLHLHVCAAEVIKVGDREYIVWFSKRTFSNYCCYWMFVSFTAKKCHTAGPRWPSPFGSIGRRNDWDDADRCSIWLLARNDRYRVARTLNRQKDAGRVPSDTVCCSCVPLRPLQSGGRCGNNLQQSVCDGCGSGLRDTSEQPRRCTPGVTPELSCV